MIRSTSPTEGNRRECVPARELAEQHPELAARIPAEHRGPIGTSIWTRGRPKVSPPAGRLVKWGKALAGDATPATAAAPAWLKRGPPLQTYPLCPNLKI